MTADHPQGTPPPGEAPRQTALTVVPISSPAREVRVTTDAVPMLDTAKFEHMQRIASIMAETSMIPDSLRMGKDSTGTQVELPMRAVVANCFMVTNQAVRWGMDPFAVAQCASVVHGKLMWEGKLVAAVIDAKLGIRLKYTFTNDTPDRKVDDQSLGVIVSGHFPDEDEPRTIEGTVARWHKGSKSPWANPGDFKRQLRYMGAREWARAHAPATMLGVITDDEADETMHRREPIVPKRLKPPAPPSAVDLASTSTVAAGTPDGAIVHQTEARSISVRGKAPPPPPMKKKPDAQTVEPTIPTLWSLRKQLDDCNSAAEVDAFQANNVGKIIELETDDREQLIEEIHAAKVKWQPGGDE